MSEFLSFLAADMNAYVTYKKASGRWSNTYELNIRYFDRHLQLYPDAKSLMQEMVTGWCAQRDTEANNSCITRIAVISGFIQYLRERGKTDVAGPTTPKAERRSYIPHAFTDAELKNFFHACDNLPEKPHSLAVLSRKLTVPVFFRLLYSSGIRTNEARMLLVDDVDLTQGILSIRCSKGETQHFVALHDTMRILLKKYDAAICPLYPGRQYFFPSKNKSFYTRDWVCKNFRYLWDMHNKSNATAYEFRHHYAIENINEWVGLGFDFDSKLLYLSKSMGHATLDSTKHYYSLTPAMADIMEKLSGQGFNDIVPEVDYEEGQ